VLCRCQQQKISLLTLTQKLASTRELPPFCSDVPRVLDKQQADFHSCFAEMGPGMLKLAIVSSYHCKPNNPQNPTKKIRPIFRLLQTSYP
jgi:hypothetical protein